MARTEAVRQFLEERGAEFDDSGRVAHFGDPDDEYQRIADGGLGLVDRGQRDTLVVHGPDAVPWLQGLVTNDLHELVEEGSGQRNAVINKTGRFVSDMRVLHIPELLVIDLEPGVLSGGLYSHLRGQIIREEVELTDRSEHAARIGVYGTAAATTLDSFADWSHPIAELGPFDGTWARRGGVDLIVQRMIWNELPGFELLFGADAAVDVHQQLEEHAGEVTWFGSNLFETLRIEAGVPRFGVELDDKVIPLEAGFDDAISFEKGCYLGQEIIARLDTRGTPAKLLRRIVLESDEPPQPTASIYAPGKEDGRSIGTLKSVVFSPKLGAAVGLGFVKRNHNDVGETVIVDGIEGTLKPLVDMTGLD